MANKILVGIVMGSDSDLETMQETTKTLEKFGIGYEANIISAHRTPQRAHEYASSAEERGLEVIIAAAGGGRAFSRSYGGLDAASGYRSPYADAAFRRP